MKYLGRLLLGLVYAAVPIVGWIALYNSFKRIKSDEIAMIQNASGSTELIEKTGIYFRPFPGDGFGQTFKKEESFIDFGPIKRVFVGNGEIAYKTIENGALELMEPGINLVCSAQNETFNKDTQLKSKQEDFIDFGAIQRVRIKPGQLGVKINSDGQYEELRPGVHLIDIARGETFDRANGIQAINQDDFVLGSHSYVTIRNGELGESYKDGIFILLEAGFHKLPANHRFVKKVPVNNDIVNLKAFTIVTVKEGEVAAINTEKGVIVKGPGKHEIRTTESNYFNAIITTSPQCVSVPHLTVMCSDRIEMRAESMFIYSVKEPLKVVGSGIEEIIGFLKKIADATLRTILSRFSSADISPSFHIDENHDSSKRNEKLKELHDESVQELNIKAKEWGLEITDLQITQILPADEVYLKTIRELGSQNSAAEAKRCLAENEAKIAEINAKAEEFRVVAAEIEQREALVKAETDSKTLAIQAEAKASQVLTEARADAEATNLRAEAEAGRITKLSVAAKTAPPVVQEVMLIEARAEILKKVDRPVFVQPELGDTSVWSRDTNGLTLFSTRRGQASSNMVESLDLAAAQRLIGSQAAF